ncbi:MAG: hypothetical protein H6709_07070 [Kofleriaceae bacterium]|nr:hypothetical protein [Kofleriaceae bacterium]MCB9571839.1 hypothetical protein [Kofleriaceae bacterium]
MDRVDQELAEVGALLVDERTLRRVIKRHLHLTGLGLQVPHAHGYALPRAELATLLEDADLAEVLARLPAEVVVVTGDRDDLGAGDADAWSQAWRGVFHGRVHHAFAARLADGLDVAAIRQRIHRLGQTEFDEVRFVLRQEDLLLPPADDVTTYVEFVAHYLELAAFAPELLAQTFPMLRGQPRVDATIALDVDAAALLAAARPGAGAGVAAARPGARRRRRDPGDPAAAGGPGRPHAGAARRGRGPPARQQRARRDPGVARRRSDHRAR